ncbi:MAG: nitroreductase family protein [Candidatus Omnitrophota bacterium]
MLDFKIDEQLCVKCGQCAKSCPAGIINMDSGRPAIAADKEAGCYRCQHCFTVCQPGAVSIFGLDPLDSRPLGKALIDPDKFETFIKGHRTIRSYRDEDLDMALIGRLLDVAGNAPSGKNDRKVRFTVIDKKEKLAELRERLVSGILALEKESRLPKGMEFVGHLAHLWVDSKVDIIFRGAPHLVIVSAPKNAISPIPDCFIALSYFDLFAHSLNVGTVWSGLAKWAIDDILPETKTFLGIPPDHVFGYAMVFGRPAVKYARTAQRGSADVHFVR